jgi:hypothetical protein
MTAAADFQLQLVKTFGILYLRGNELPELTFCSKEYRPVAVGSTLCITQFVSQIMLCVQNPYTFAKCCKNYQAQMT